MSGEVLSEVYTRDQDLTTVRYLSLPEHFSPRRKER